ncbi:low molecular weight protein-tyrosine-phosphatase [Pseudoxanthomonas mexicana]|uniref:low molecular weight protein-tyrosine-phosphatase n=1 Tax=Pseudoxanthomonas mexicana TaxID=128785 RepID=UPI00398B8C30
MRLLFVCLGNICRSPMAEGALRARLREAGLGGRVEVDSAGTGDWHVGHPPDHRAIACARGHGVDIAGLRARQLQRQDFERFDWLLCADAQNLRDARRRAPPQLAHKAVLLLEWAGIPETVAVPDPYTGCGDDFELTWRLVDSAASAVVARLAAGPESGIIDRW